MARGLANQMAQPIVIIIISQLALQASHLMLLQTSVNPVLYRLGLPRNGSGNVAPPQC